MHDTGKDPQEASDRPGEAVERWLLLLLVAATLVHWLLFLLHVPVLQHLPGWFWEFRDKPIGSWGLLALLGLMPFLGVRLWQARWPSSLKVCGIFALGLINQFGFALVEGRGLAGLRDRMIYSGHAEFATVAVGYQDSAWEVMTHYQQLLGEGQLGVFAHSKPPGQLLLYLASAKIANAFHPTDPTEAAVSITSAVGLAATPPDVAQAPWIARSMLRPTEGPLNRLWTFAAFVWPCLSYLVLLPLYLIARQLGDARTAVLACLFYVFVPAVTLITLHTDQVFFPLFFSVPICLALYGFRGNLGWASLLTGVSVYLALFFTFAQVMVLPFLAAIALASILEGQENRVARMKAVAGQCFLALAGFVGLWWLFQAVFHYDLVAMYRHALEFHHNWKGWDNTLETLVYFAFLNALEYALWSGLPLVLLWGMGCVQAVSRILRRAELNQGTVFQVALAGVFGLLLFFGKTKSEVARLWLFLTPCVVLSAAGSLLARPRADRTNLILGVLVLEWGTILVTKLRQDF